MSSYPSDHSNRREFLTGGALRKQIERAGGEIADALIEGAAKAAPEAGDTVRLTARAMACDWGIVFNPGPAQQIMAASDAFDVVHALEDQMSVYRDQSELSRLNRTAATEAVKVERKLFELLLLARDISRETGRAFDPTTGPLISLWRNCRAEGRIPTDEEIAAQLEITGIDQVSFDDAESTVGFAREGVELNLGAIGKGYAVDRAGEFLEKYELNDWLIHGGRSSILARGDHIGLGGWPVGLRNPLLPHERFATAILKNSAMATSG
ncbi:MAG: FAD:protein FMN transferase, partial [Planctomycetaceae bacterium]